MNGRTELSKCGWEHCFPGLQPGVFSNNQSAPQDFVDFWYVHPPGQWYLSQVGQTGLYSQHLPPCIIWLLLCMSLPSPVPFPAPPGPSLPLRSCTGVGKGGVLISPLEEQWCNSWGWEAVASWWIKQATASQLTMPCSPHVNICLSLVTKL